MLLFLQDAAGANPDELSLYVHRFGYAGIFLWFITLDQLTPVPEEITLLSIGYLAANHVFNPVYAGLASLAAFLTVDTVYYFLARSGYRITKKVSRKNHFLQRYTEGLKKHMVQSQFVLCFIPRMRLFGPILVGTLNLSFRKFFVTDLVALSLFTCLYISIGIVFHKGLYRYLEELESLRHGIFIATVLAAAVIFILWMRKKKRAV